MSEEDDAFNEWEQWWDARVAAMESLYGTSDDLVGHAVTPFDFGAEGGGGPDLVYFKNKVPGIITVTSELIGRDDQVANELGNYELAICNREDDDWAAGVITGLAYESLGTVLNPGDTMELESAVPEDSTISALLFCDFGRFEVLGRKAGVLLCLGITPDELAACREGRREEVLEKLREQGVYPFTDLHRPSVLHAV